MTKSGHITIVGTGIRAGGHITPEAVAQLRACDRLFYLVADGATSQWLQELKPSAEPLSAFIVQGKSRGDTYHQMANRIMTTAAAGHDVCVAFYGHPSVFVYPTQLIMSLARGSDIPARILPGISSEACMFADLGIDPGRTGVQCFEATDFLVYRRRPDVQSAVVLWQVGVVGCLHHTAVCDREALALLRDYLLTYYAGDHTAILYEAAQFAVCEPLREPVKIAGISVAAVSVFSTLYIPPAQPLTPDPDTLRSLGLRAPRWSETDYVWGLRQPQEGNG